MVSEGWSDPDKPLTRHILTEFGEMIEKRTPVRTKLFEVLSSIRYGALRYSNNVNEYPGSLKRQNFIRTRVSGYFQHAEALVRL